MSVLFTGKSSWVVGIPINKPKGTPIELCANNPVFDFIIVKCSKMNSYQVYSIDVTATLTPQKIDEKINSAKKGIPKYVKAMQSMYKI